MTSIADAGAGLAIIGVGVLGLLIYFIPIIVGRRKRNAKPLFLHWISFWDGQSWVGSPPWSGHWPAIHLCLRPYSWPRRFYVAVAEYSAPGSQFCNSCGGKLIFNWRLS